MTCLISIQIPSIKKDARGCFAQLLQWPTLCVLCVGSTTTVQEFAISAIDYIHFGSVTRILNQRPDAFLCRNGLKKGQSLAADEQQNWKNFAALFFFDGWGSGNLEGYVHSIGSRDLSMWIWSFYGSINQRPSFSLRLYMVTMWESYCLHYPWNNASQNGWMPVEECGKTSGGQGNWYYSVNSLRSSDNDKEMIYDNRKARNPVVIHIWYWSYT